MTATTSTPPAKPPPSSKPPSNSKPPSKKKKTPPKIPTGSVLVDETKLRTLVDSLIDDGDPEFMTLATELKNQLPQPIYEPEPIAIQALQYVIFRITHNKLPRDQAILVLQTLDRQYSLRLQEEED
jgi:hypothetical protein